MPNFNPGVTRAILRARENDPRHIISRNDAKKIGAAVDRALSAPGADPAAVAQALRFVGYGVPTGRAKKLIASANRKLDNAVPIVVIGDEGAPYAVIEADVWDANTRRLRTTNARVSQALLDRANEALDGYARNYVLTVLQGGDPMTDAELTAEMDKVSEQLSINFLEDSDRGVVALSGSSAGSDNLPPTSFTIYIDKVSGQITDFADAD